ncbi:glycoside hydrolase family 5 protein [Runella salmonicolor]|uniref:Glycoside hydrolase family 5 protein n=1 Tax=Runella salmonicolor TaxID=2950278 RepID=A0ABT1FP34_9BACT|nr:cellulase family glycosylhydrolase [Runella salmonicolor]MCP1382528.1 glycoside hydrolase family 5 protein [Runella salmonicolor]
MKLGKGINYSRYCWQWRGTFDNPVINHNGTDYMDAGVPGRDQISASRIAEATAHVALIKKLGFDTVRLPITFHCWAELNNHLIDPNHRYWIVLENMIAACQQHNLKLVICYHHAPTINVVRVLSMWQQIAQRPAVLGASDEVLFEIFNEPNDTIDNTTLHQHYLTIINAIRTIPQHANRWIVVGGNEWNDIGYDDKGLTGFEPLGLPNILYTFHSYEPKAFTNQGLVSEPCFQTTGLSFPFQHPMPTFVASVNCPTSPSGFNEGRFKYDNYDQDEGNGTHFGMATVEFIERRIQDAKGWSIRNGDLPIWCGEWGLHRHIPTIPDDGSIERFMSAMLDSFKTQAIDWCWWDFEGPFTIFDPVPDIVHLPDSFGVVVSTEANVSPLVKTLMVLNERIDFQVTHTGTGGPWTNTSKITFKCIDSEMNIKEYILTVTGRVRLGQPLFFKQTIKKFKPIYPKKLFNFKGYVSNETAMQSAVLTVVHNDGSSFSVAIQ